MEQYFHTMGIEDDATKVYTVVTLLWWHRSELILQTFKLSEKEDFYWFEDGLKPWVKHELSRQGIIELTIVMVDAEFFVELGTKKDKGNEKNGGNGKPHNGKWRPNNKPKRLLKCFRCDSLHMVRDCPNKYTFYAIEGDDKLDEVVCRNLVGWVRPKGELMYLWVCRRPLEGVLTRYWLCFNTESLVSQRRRQNRRIPRLPSVSRHSLRMSRNTPEDTLNMSILPSMSRHSIYILDVSTSEGGHEATMRLGSIVCSVKAKRVRENEKKPMKCFLYYDLCISEKVVGKLGLSVSKLTKKIKMVNSKEVPTVGVA
ncbi:hypothetical protein Gotur_003752 [Gossypium turneri]